MEKANKPNYNELIDSIDERCGGVSKLVYEELVRNGQINKWEGVNSFVAMPLDPYGNIESNITNLLNIIKKQGALNTKLGIVIFANTIAFDERKDECKQNRIDSIENIKNWILDNSDTTCTIFEQDYLSFEGMAKIRDVIGSTISQISSHFSTIEESTMICLDAGITYLNSKYISNLHNFLMENGVYSVCTGISLSDPKKIQDDVDRNLVIIKNNEIIDEVKKNYYKNPFDMESALAIKLSKYLEWNGFCSDVNGVAESRHLRRCQDIELSTFSREFIVVPGALNYKNPRRTLLTLEQSKKPNYITSLYYWISSNGSEARNLTNFDIKSLQELQKNKPEKFVNDISLLVKLITRSDCFQIINDYIVETNQNNTSIEILLPKIMVDLESVYSSSFNKISNLGIEVEINELFVTQKIKELSNTNIQNILTSKSIASRDIRMSVRAFFDYGNEWPITSDDIIYFLLAQIFESPQLFYVEENGLSKLNRIRENLKL